MATTNRDTGPEQHASGPATDRLMQIGEAAERVGLSIRTIRHYEEAGLIVPSARSEGGFRLYTEPDLDRLAVVKRMKPLGFTIDEMCDLLAVLDALNAAIGTDRAALLDRLAMFQIAATARVTALRHQLATAEGFANTLRAELDHHGHGGPHYLNTAAAWSAAACLVRSATVGTASPSCDRAAAGVGRGHRGALVQDGWSARVL